MPTLRRFVLFLLLTSLAIGTVFAIVGFSQNVPSVTVNGSLAPACGTGTTSLTATPNSVTAGTSGNILLSCGTNAALTATNGPVTATPTFTLTTGYTGLWMVAGSANCPLTGTITGTQITSGTQFIIPNGSYDYCASFTNAAVGGLSSFTVSWA